MSENWLREGREKQLALAGKLAKKILSESKDAKWTNLDDQLALIPPEELDVKMAALSRGQELRASILAVIHAYTDWLADQLIQNNNFNPRALPSFDPDWNGDELDRISKNGGYFKKELLYKVLESLNGRELPFIGRVRKNGILVPDKDMLAKWKLLWELERSLEKNSDK